MGGLGTVGREEFAPVRTRIVKAFDDLDANRIDRERALEEIHAAIQQRELRVDAELRAAVYELDLSEEAMLYGSSPGAEISLARIREQWARLLRAAEAANVRW